MVGLIPKELSHIWIGHLPAPIDWMNTWRDKHPNWNYTLYDQAYLDRTTFRTQSLIDEYVRRGRYAGAADLMRYEILYEIGGFMPGADSICLHPVDELFTQGCAYTVYENEFVRGKLVSPILACRPGDPFVATLIETLTRLSPAELDEPWISTGNLFVAQMIEKHQPDVHVFPSHTFIPVHHTGLAYQGDEKIYCKQLFGSTRNAYPEKSRTEALLAKIRARRQKRYRRATTPALYQKFEERSGSDQ